MKVEYNHGLDQNTALEKVKNFAEVLKAQYKDQVKDYTEKWFDNKGEFSAKIMGLDISGILEVLQDKLVIKIDLPMMAQMFKGQIKNTIVKTLDDLFKK